MCRVCAGVCRGWRRTLDALELESQVAVSHLMWVLGLNSGFLEEHRVLLAADPCPAL